METAATMPTGWKRLALGRGAGLAAGVVLCIEALCSPFVWWGAFIAGAFVSLGGDKEQNSWLDAMARLGSWGPLVLLVPFAGAAIAVLGRPSRGRAPWGVLCLIAALFNLLPAVALVVYNIGSSRGPVAPRIVGVGFGIAFGFVAARAFADGVRYLRRGPAELVALPLPPPPA